LENENADLKTNQDQVQKRLEEATSRLEERENFIQNLNKRIKALSEEWTETETLDLSKASDNYNLLRAQVLSESILPNLYKKRLATELNLVNVAEEGKSLKELNEIKELIEYHENELRQLLQA
ncbi:hypothetical protein JW964_24300, partial [candidate division KSB1 bacterium]|nr:hypothetical protein [candidate division KSB1 bacterium]